jgi:hypothetical protein
MSIAIFSEKRILFFAENANNAEAQINSAVTKNWPSVNFSLQKEFIINEQNVFLFRALCEDFTAWNSGSVERFVY